MTDTLFRLPSNDQALKPAFGPDTTIAEFLSNRRSTPLKMINPALGGPDAAELEGILQTAMRVPDHRKLAPWRMVVFSGEARAAFGETLANRYLELHPEAKPKSVEEERNRLMRAPICISIISSPVEDKKGTPIWEQELSAGALCLNILYAANAAGYSANWLTEWWAFDDGVNAALGLAAHERIAGHIFLGRCEAKIYERPRPEFADKVSYWGS